jgi:hypothetical protein
MCRKIVFGFAVFTFVFVLAAITIEAQSEVGSSTSSTPYVTVYTDEGFHGESEKFLIGEYPKIDDRWKDEIKSVQITGPVRVTLFDKEQFGGRKQVIEHSTAKLVGEMKGEAASMIVEEFKCSYATGYKKSMFEGESKEFRVGDYPEGWDDMQSLYVCGGIEVTVYDKKNYEGKSMTLKTGRMDLGAFRKKVKSMKVVESAGE